MSDSSQQISNTLKKLSEIDSQTNEVWEKVPRVAGKVFDFLKGLGKGASKEAPKPKVDPHFKGDPHATPADDIIDAPAKTSKFDNTKAQDTNVKWSKEEPTLGPQDTSIRPGEKSDPTFSSVPELKHLIDAVKFAAAKNKMFIPASALKKGLAEGKTVEQIAMELYPEHFAKVKSNPSALKKFYEFWQDFFNKSESNSKATNPQIKKRWILLAIMAVAASLKYCGQPVTDGEAQKEKDMASDDGMGKPADEVTSIPADEIPWKYLGINPKAYEGSTLEKTTIFGKALDDNWNVKLPNGRQGGVISDPALKERINKLLQMTPEQRKALKSAENATSVELWPANVPSAAPVEAPSGETKPDIVIKKAEEPKEPASAAKKKEKKGTQSDW